MEQLFGAIPTVLKPLGANADVSEALVFAAWARCAGELLRERTVPLEFVEKRLLIGVQDNTWKRHLEELSPQMLVKLNGSLGQGTVKYIEFRIDERAVNAKRGQAAIEKTETESVEIDPSLANAADAIADENLRKQFLGAATSYLAKNGK